MYTRFMSWSRMVYLAGIVLALILVIPTAWFPFQLAKIAVFATFLLVSGVLFVAGGGAREFLRSHGFWGAILVALLPLSYVLSSFFSVDKPVALLGYSIETDTIIFATLAFLAFILSFTFFRTLRTARLLLTTVYWSLFAAVIFQWVAITLGVPFATFSDHSVNLIGKWNDLGLLAGVLFVLVLSSLEMGHLSKIRKGVSLFAAAALALMLALINFTLVWGLVLVAAIILGVVKFLTSRHTEHGETAEASRSLVSKIPWVAAGSAVLAIIFIFFGSSLNNGLTGIFPVSSLEVRPSYSSTLAVVDSARAGSFGRVLVGTGPNTFGENWLRYKPAEVNQSNFWNLDFNVGFSTLATALGTVGLVGVVAWLIPLILVLAALVRAIRRSLLSREERVTAIGLILAALFTISAIALYVPSQNIILLAMVLAGAAFGFLWRQGQPGASTEPITASGFQMILSFGIVAVILLLVLWTGVTTDRYAISEAITNKGLVALQAGDVDTALARAAKAQGFAKNADALRLAINAGGTKLQKTANDKTLTQDQLRNSFTTILQNVVTAARDSSQLYPTDYRTYFYLAQIYDYLASLKIQGAYENAKQAYLAAVNYNPTNPQIPLLLAHLEANQGNVQGIQAPLAASLTLKPNYTDAILFVVQLNVAQNDLPSAIKNTTIAAQTAPGIAPIWFELGLLYYARNDTQNAIPAFEKAMSIQPDYANAQYFLGLSYFAQQKTSDAIAQFTSLAKSNPDNAEVKGILANLLAGRAPFTNATPPVIPPQKRSTAPINQ